MQTYNTNKTGIRKREIDEDRVIVLALGGLNQTKISRALGVSITTFKNRLRENCDLASRYEKARSDYARANGMGTLKMRSGQLQIVRVESAEAKALNGGDGEDTVFKFIEANPGSTFEDIRRGTRLTEARVSSILATLLLETERIRTAKRREDNQLNGFDEDEEFSPGRFYAVVTKSAKSSRNTQVSRTRQTKEDEEDDTFSWSKRYVA